MTHPILTKVQIARRQLALADDDYRAILERVTGRTSSKGLPDGALEAVLAEFRRLGWTPKAGKTGDGYGKPHVRKIYALWKEAGIVGAISNASKEALRAFVERQTKRSAPEFCSPAEANKVSEGIKAMIRRAEAGR